MTDWTAKRLTAIRWRSPVALDTPQGETQPHLFETTGGLCVVKVANCPQQPPLRALTNDLVGSLCLHWLGINHPATAIVDVPAEVIAASDGGARFSFEGRWVDLAPGLAFGSAYWASEPPSALTDPSAIMNRRDLAGTFAYNSWIRWFDNQEYRVTRVADGFRFFPVDQGCSFGDPAWDVSALARDDVIHMPLQVPTVGTTRRHEVTPFIDRLREFNEGIARAIVDQVPVAWCDEEDRRALSGYLCRRAPLAAAMLEVWSE
jgi:hypothetical protein